jgi:hypothetical protein
VVMETIDLAEVAELLAPGRNEDHRHRGVQSERQYAWAGSHRGRRSNWRDSR